MVAVLDRGVRLFGKFDGLDKRLLKLLNALDGGRPTFDNWRLNDDQLYFSCAIKRPLRLGGTHGASSVEHQLLVFFSRHWYARAKLPIKNDGLVADAADQVSRAKHARQQITKANACFDFVFHLLVWVYFVKQRQAHHDLFIV